MAGTDGVVNFVVALCRGVDCDWFHLAVGDVALDGDPFICGNAHEDSDRGHARRKLPLPLRSGLCIGIATCIGRGGVSAVSTRRSIKGAIVKL